MLGHFPILDFFLGLFRRSHSVCVALAVTLCGCSDPGPATQVSDASADVPMGSAVDAGEDAMSIGRRFGIGMRRRGVQVSPALPLWSPLVLSPTLWFEPRNGEFTTNAARDVDTVTDRSAEGNNLATAGGSTSLPEMDWANTLLKRRAVDFTFTGSPALVTGSNVDLSQPYLLWALVDVDRTGTVQYVSRPTTTVHGMNRTGTDGWRLLFGSTGADSLTLPDSGTGVKAILFFVDPVGKTCTGWLDDWTGSGSFVDRSASGTITAPDEPLLLGVANTSGSSPFDGRIASYGIAPMASVPTSDERDALGLYLNAQFNASIVTTITDPANIPGYRGVQQPPAQIVILGVGQSNRKHDADPLANTDMPLITGGGGARYLTQYPITLYEWSDSADPAPLHYRVINGGNPPTRTFGREVVWAHRGANAGPGIELYIAKASFGSTSLADDWDPDTTESTTLNDPGFMYWRSKDRLQTITDAIRPTARFIIGWTQGEADSNVEAEALAYEANQDNLFDAYISLASSLSLSAPEFYDSQLHEGWENPPVSRPYWAEVVAAKVAVAAARSDTTLIPQGSSIPLQSGDEIHITAEGQTLMGEAEADAAGF